MTHEDYEGHYEDDRRRWRGESGRRDPESRGYGYREPGAYEHGRPPRSYDESWRGRAEGSYGAEQEHSRGRQSGGYGSQSEYRGSSGQHRQYDEGQYRGQGQYREEHHGGGQYGGGQYGGGQYGGGQYGEGQYRSSGSQYGRQGEYGGGQGGYSQAGGYGQSGGYGGGQYASQAGSYGGQHGGQGQYGSYGSQGSSYGGGGWSQGQGSYPQGYGASGTAQSHRGRGPRGYQRSDERIREDINERMTDDSELDASEIEVEVKDGMVTLSGTVPERQAKRRAEDIAESVSGVSNVQNNVKVKSKSDEDKSKTQRSDTDYDTTKRAQGARTSSTSGQSNRSI